MDVLTDHVQVLGLTCLLYLIWVQVLMHLLLLLRVIYLVQWDQTVLLQEQTWMVTECLLLLQVKWVMDQWDLLQVKVDLLQVIWPGDQTDPWDQADQIHYSVKVDHKVDLQVDQTDLLQVIWVTDQWDLLQVIWVTDQWDLLLMEWATCTRIWMMLVHIKLQKDHHQVILVQCQAICLQTCLHRLTIQTTVVK